MDTFKIVLGSLASIIALGSYLPYFRDIFKASTKPHAFSWLIWTLLDVIAFAAQVVEKGGAGTWVTGVSAVFCFAIFILALKKGEKKFVLFDWISLAGALLALLLWLLTNDPTLSVILVTITDAIGYLPTFRKGYLKPYEETLILFGLSAVKFVFGIMALETFTLATWLYPASLVLTNTVFVVMVLIRRKQVRALA